MEPPAILMLGEHVLDTLPVVLGDVRLDFFLGQPGEIGDGCLCRTDLTSHYMGFIEECDILLTM